MHRVLAPVCLAVLAACSPKAPDDPQVFAPSALVSAAQKAGVAHPYVNPSARETLADMGISIDPALPPQLASDTSGWRKLDRQVRFDGVILAGPLKEFQTLLAHLLESPDFRLVHVDNWGFVFTRQRPATYDPPEPKSVTAETPTARGDVLSQTALYLEAARIPRSAGAYMESALEAAPGEPIVQARAASLQLSRRQPHLALDHAERALQADPKNLSALEIKSRASLDMGATDLAWQAAEQLKAAAPADDMNVLYFHARMANSAGAYSREEDSLEKLVKLAEKQGLPTTDYRVYLAQCYARQGLARPALEQLETASKEPHLTDSQKEDIATAIKSVRSRTGTLAQ